MTLVRAFLASKLWQSLNHLGTVQFILSVAGALLGTGGAIAVAQETVGKFHFVAQVLIYLGVALLVFAVLVAFMAWLNRTLKLHPGPLFEPPAPPPRPRFRDEPGSSTSAAERNAQIISDVSKHRAESSAKDRELTKLRADVGAANTRVEALESQLSESKAREQALLKRLAKPGEGVAAVRVPAVPVKTDHRGDDRRNAGAEIDELLETGRTIAETLRGLELEAEDAEPVGDEARIAAKQAGEWLRDASETEAYWFPPDTTNIMRLATAGLLTESNRPVRAPRWRQQLVTRVERQLDALDLRKATMK